MDLLDSDLKMFLQSSGLEHLENVMLENGMTLEILAHANENELSALTTRLVDKIKLRTELEKLTRNKQSLLLKISPNNPSTSTQIHQNFLESPEGVTLLVRQDSATSYIKVQESGRETTVQNLTAISTPTGRPDQRNVIPTTSVIDTPNLSKEFSLNELLNSELDLILSQDSSQENSDKTQNVDSIHRLLRKDTAGKILLEKYDKGQNLDSRDRALIVKLVVDAELKALDQLNHTIRRDIWLQWANAISECFKGEPKSLYYVPYHVIEGKVIQASGLIHNRLITHRRSLATGTKRRRSDSSDSGNSSKSSVSDGNKRVRPFPEKYNKSCTESRSSLHEHLDWLRGSSSPYEVVCSKWQDTFELRAKLLKSHTYQDYFNTFPALKLPDGYKLLSRDFETVYPDGNGMFEEKFPIVKIKLLHLLAEKGESSKVDQSTLELLELAAVGEEQANLAALLSIVTLLRQMPTISIPKKKVWKLSRDEVRNSFMARVATSSEIERFCTQRQMICTAKGIPNQPFILAVGPSWENVSQYEIVVNVGLRYQLPNVCSAIKHTYNLYWALDCAYPRESAPCWMLIQRTMFQMSSKYDTEGVPLRELIRQLK